MSSWKTTSMYISNRMAVFADDLSRIKQGQIRHVPSIHTIFCTLSSYRDILIRPSVRVWTVLPQVLAIDGRLTIECSDMVWWKNAQARSETGCTHRYSLKKTYPYGCRSILESIVHCHSCNVVSAVERFWTIVRQIQKHVT